MMTRRMIPPFHRLKDVVLADSYEMTRDGLSVMVARGNLTYNEIAEIVKNGRLADSYEMTRDGLPVMVAREDLTYDEIDEIVEELMAELTAERDLALGGGKKGPSTWRKQ